ncbi:DUF2171 domain-containing protein [Deinococcus sp. KNUC1210]|uniref:DUF2171 domain-containing protein n=1 Tax=Deinococcus sp. KNUC1210 TaxID=2917691 RepID=UPI001EEFE34E|nr:DUF2171 domain-containing protein [Deinococcus sp. KNUC1210]ULH14374.1 DUF2171 domain-containing protein [Deinococcus sp. KNUC1210]
MRLEDIKPGLMVHARGDGSMGGAPGEHVGTVIGVEGESLHMQQEGAGEVWIPLAWVSWTDDRTIHLSKTASEFVTGAEHQAPSRQVGP